MDSSLFIIAIALLVLEIVTIILVIVRSKGSASDIGPKMDMMQKSIGDEFSRSRLESQNSSNQLREEVGKRLDNMNDKIESQNRGNVENREKILETIMDLKDKNSENAAKQNTLLVESIGKMQESNEKKLEEMRVTVDEKLSSTLTKRLDSSFQTVSEQLEKLYKSLGEMQSLSTGVTENVTALNRVLTNVKTRGVWAEVQLEGILDQTIPNMYDKNVKTVPNSNDLVEFAIKIPSSEKGEKDIYLPLDSKFPMEDYIRLCEAADIADQDAVIEARKALEKRVIEEAKTVSKYIHVPDTTPFAIMYLATEGLYAEIASSKNAIPEKVQNDYNVMIAGPSTITALLNSLSMGFRTVAINEKANEVRTLLAAIKTQYGKFDELLTRAKKRIDEAGKTIEDAQDRNYLIQKKLKNVESIDTDEGDKLILGNSPVDFIE